MVRKSLYIFLCALLGLFLFTILHRTAVLVYFYFLSHGVGAEGFDYFRFLFWDSFTLLLSMMLGSWYGIWLGIFWHDKVYEERSHGGVVDHLSKHYWPGKPKHFEAKVAAVKHRLEKDLWQLENLTEMKSASSISPEPKVRRMPARRRAPKIKA